MSTMWLLLKMKTSHQYFYCINYKALNQPTSYAVFQLHLVILYKVCFHTEVEDAELLHFQILLLLPKTNILYTLL